MSEATYKLEYWVDKINYSKEDLESKLSQNLEKLDTNITVKAESDYHLVTIEADKHNINACHDHLNFDREEIFRAKDELGDELRSKAYPILAEIETRLRRFITRAMIEVLDFNWWEHSAPKNVKKSVNKIESGAKQSEDHHQIEFTMFDDLIELVTGKYQKWPDSKNLTPADLTELLDDCETIEELKQKLSQNREQTSLWEDVFSSYFDDPKDWNELEGKIEDTVIPIRNKVMHHRRIRIYEVDQLKKHRDELLQVIGTAKSELPAADLNKALKSLRTLVKNASSQFALDPEFIERLEQSARIDPEIIKGIMQNSQIDPDIMKGFTSAFNFRVQGFDNDPTSGKDNEEDSNGNEKNDQNGEDKSDDENDSSEDDTNGDNDKKDET